MNSLSAFRPMIQTQQEDGMETTSRWVGERIANVHETNGDLTSAG